MKRPQYEAEGLLPDAAASHVGGGSRSHGWLFLTKQRVVFSPAKSGAPTRLELRLGDIADVKLVDNAFKKRIQVVDKQQQTHAFIVLEPELWVIAISRAAAAVMAPTSARSASE